MEVRMSRWLPTDQRKKRDETIVKQSKGGLSYTQIADRWGLRKQTIFIILRQSRGTFQEATSCSCQTRC